MNLLRLFFWPYLFFYVLTDDVKLINYSNYNPNNTNSFTLEKNDFALEGRHL